MINAAYPIPFVEPRRFPEFSDIASVAQAWQIFNKVMSDHLLQSFSGVRPAVDLAWL